MGELNRFTSQQTHEPIQLFSPQHSLSNNYFLDTQISKEAPEPIFTYDTYSTQNNSDTASISVNIGSPSLQVTVNGASQTDPESIVRIIREHLPELTDAIATQLADAIQKVFANLPLVS